MRWLPSPLEVSCRLTPGPAIQYSTLSFTLLKAFTMLKGDPLVDARPILQLDGMSLSRQDLPGIARGEVHLALAPDAVPRIAASRKIIDGFLAQDKLAYGVNTGFGRFASVRISDAQIRQLQKNLVRSHGAGVGEPIPDEVVRLTLAFRANALAQGWSGIRRETLERLLAIYNEGLIPWMPCQGSVGASGDLAPLAHLAQVLIGAGRAKVDDCWLDGRT
ncbi:MAG: aromatic amino acid lyase, partial [Planctomycetota bacterium]